MKLIHNNSYALIEWLPQAGRWFVTIKAWSGKEFFTLCSNGYKNKSSAINYARKHLR